MKLEFCYDMQVSFQTPITEHYYALMCLPQDTRRQRVLHQLLTIEPDGPQDIEEDYFGNQILRGQIEEAHTSFNVKLEGVVETGMAPHEAYEEQPSAIYRVFSQYTNPGTTLRAFYQKMREAMPPEMQTEEAVYERAHYWMQAIGAHMTYEPGVTDVETRAEEAFAGGKGVCQDYAHIYLALLRQDGISARYVVGMMEGEGASHAWVEVNCKGYWYGFDPTNQLLVGDQYIKISHGRDYADCIVIRGIFRGGAEQSQRITVSVKGVK